jgi:hypothetical protein
LAGDGRLAPGTRTVVESRHDAELTRPSQTSLDCLVRHPEGSPGRVERRLLAIGQQEARPLDVVRRFRPRTRDALRSDNSFSENDTSITRRGAATTISPSANPPKGDMDIVKPKGNPPDACGFMESIH